MVTVSCKKDDPDPDPDPEVVLDGIYLKGAGTALVELNEKGMLKPTRNEVNQTDRAALLEIYVAVKAGSDGFNIVKVAGSTRTTYGLVPILQWLPNLPPRNLKWLFNVEAMPKTKPSSRLMPMASIMW